jgi:hypothetical protein
LSDVRKCDALCHQAKRKNCNCWCTGRYHGVGPEEARKRVLEDFELEIEGDADFSLIVGEGYDWGSVTQDEIEVKQDYRKVIS